MIWGVLALAALLWPARPIGPLDGIPLDRWSEAILVGVAAPALWWLDPAFVRGTRARALVVALLAVKLISMAALTQQGWCARFVTPVPVNADGRDVQLVWDARADWRDAVPRCSAIVAHPYGDLRSFPVWFLNLVGPARRPPDAVVAMTIDGYLNAPDAGVLNFPVTGGRTIAAAIDERPIDPTRDAVAAAAGPHRFQLSTVLSGGAWRFAPTWNDRDVFASTLTTTGPPRLADRWFGRAMRWVVALLAALLIASWTASAIAALRPTRAQIAWVAAASAVCLAAGYFRLHTAGRLSVLLLFGAAAVPIPDRLRHARSAFLMIAVPWLAIVAGSTIAEAGRVTFYTPGDDFTQFQRFAYRIYMQGYWLEGGQWTFWNQPLYRWIAGLLHIVFGDASVGEWYLDAACLAIGAMFAFVVCHRAASFRWGVAASALTLATLVAGPSWWIIGRGLSEIAACGFAYAAVLLLITDDRGGISRVALASALVVLALYTRLNHLPWLLASTAFCLPSDVRASDLWRPRAWMGAFRVRRAAVIVAALALALAGFAWRTWYYTGVFSVFYGTTRQMLATIQPGDSFSSSALKVIQSVLVVVTAQDPPAFDIRAVPIIAGVTISVLALLRVPGCRDVPASIAVFCVAAIAGAFVARGEAYVGRFSIHVIPVAVAAIVCAVAPRVRARAAGRPTCSPASPT